MELWAFTAMAAVIVAVPGPSVLFTISRAIAYGRGPALLTVLGNAVGLLAVGLLVALGLAAIVVKIPVVFTAIKILGALYLIYLGVQAIRARESDPVGTAATGRRFFREGLIVGLTNPKSAVFFAAVLPQFVTDPSAPALQMSLMVVIFAMLAVAMDSIWAFSAAAARSWLSARERPLQIGGGTIMIGLGLWSLRHARA